MSCLPIHLQVSTTVLGSNLSALFISPSFQSPTGHHSGCIYHLPLMGVAFCGSNTSCVIPARHCWLSPFSVLEDLRHLRYKLEVLSGALTPCAKLDVYLGYTHSQYKNMTYSGVGLNGGMGNEEMRKWKQVCKTQQARPVYWLSCP